MALSPTMRRLSSNLLPYKGKLLVIILLGMLVAFVQPASAKLTQLIIDSLKGTNGAATFQFLPFLLMGLFVVGGIAKYFYNTFRRRLVERILQDFREMVFNKYLVFRMSFLDRSRTGELLNSMQNDINRIGEGADTVFGILKEPVTFIGLLAMAIYFDWRLLLYSSCVAPLVVLLFSLPGAAVKRYSIRNLALFADLVSLGQEVLIGSRVVRIFGLEEALKQKFRENQSRYFKTTWKSIGVQELAAPSVELLGATIMSLILFYGGSRIATGQMTAGDLVGFILTLGLCQMPIKGLNNAYLKLKGAEAAADRVFSILDAEEDLDGGKRKLESFQNRIVFEGVSLSYSGKPALRNVSFEINRGECVAFVGSSGSGKSSLMNLLPRFYDPTEGRILLDNHDIRDYRLADLRSQIGLVSQDVFLFHDSLLENVRYGNLKSSRAEIVRALELAYCSDFLQRMPQGVDTLIGERGICLSGGERQRVAIARAILKNAPILILDEATSNLDSQSEKFVQGALEFLMQGRTTLMVAHRFSVVARAEKIYVLKDGLLLEVGTQSDLRQKNSHFYELFSASFEGGLA